MKNSNLTYNTTSTNKKQPNPKLGKRLPSTKRLVQGPPSRFTSSLNKSKKLDRVTTQKPSFMGNRNVKPIKQRVEGDTSSNNSNLAFSQLKKRSFNKAVGEKKVYLASRFSSSTASKGNKNYRVSSKDSTARNTFKGEKLSLVNKSSFNKREKSGDFKVTSGAQDNVKKSFKPFVKSSNTFRPFRENSPRILHGNTSRPLREKLSENPQRTSPFSRFERNTGFNKADEGRGSNNFNRGYSSSNFTEKSKSESGTNYAERSKKPFVRRSAGFNKTDEGRGSNNFNRGYSSSNFTEKSKSELGENYAEGSKKPFVRRSAGFNKTDEGRGFNNFNRGYSSSNFRGKSRGELGTNYTEGSKKPFLGRSAGFNKTDERRGFDNFNRGYSSSDFRGKSRSESGTNYAERSKKPFLGRSAGFNKTDEGRGFNNFNRGYSSSNFRGKSRSELGTNYTEGSKKPFVRRSSEFNKTDERRGFDNFHRGYSSSDFTEKNRDNLNNKANILFAPLSEEDQKEEEQLKILLKQSIMFEDDSILVINKPAGLAVQGGSKIKYSIDDLLNKNKFNKQYLVVHRLDKDTTGVLVFAKNVQVAQILGEQFKANKIEKQYLALIAGTMRQKKGTLNCLVEVKCIGGEEITIANYKSGKEAITDYEVLQIAKDKRVSLVLLKPLTGRKHQIRAQLKLCGTPILGDGKYGKIKSFVPGYGTKINLHAFTLKLSLPEVKGFMNFQAPFPPHLAENIKILGKSSFVLTRNLPFTLNDLNTSVNKIS